MIVADSDVLIDYLRATEPSARRVRLEIQTGALATTAVNAFELWAGARAGRTAQRVQTLLDALVILPLDDVAAERAGEVRRTLTARGVDIGMADSLVAGICLVGGHVLLTRNVRHFERVAGLHLGGAVK
jgi:predicted nucleic acid-binding protein